MATTAINGIFWILSRDNSGRENVTGMTETQINDQFSPTHRTDLAAGRMVQPTFGGRQYVDMVAAARLGF